MFIERDEILRNSRYKERLENLEPDVFDDLVARADSYTTMRTRHNYSATKNPVVQQSLKTVTWRLIDYLYFCDNETDMDNRLAGIKSESIGDYSYTVKSVGDDVGIGLTGDYELDLLLDSLTVGKKRPIYFNVAGSTRKNKKNRGGRRVF